VVLRPGGWLSQGPGENDAAARLCRKHITADRKDLN
jgi:hypothetical protein